jgi:hypothetical protein
LQLSYSQSRIKAPITHNASASNTLHPAPIASSGSLLDFLQNFRKSHQYGLHFLDASGYA